LFIVDQSSELDVDWDWKPDSSDTKRERRRGWLGSHAGDEPLTKDEEYRRAAFEEFRRQHRRQPQEEPKEKVEHLEEEKKKDLDEPISEVDLLASEMFKSVIDDTSNHEGGLDNILSRLSRKVVQIKFITNLN
jgi:transcription termination factor NusB